MKTTYIGVTDPPRRVESGEVIDGERFVGQTPSYGRVIFTKVVLMEVVGRGATIQNCVFQQG